MLDVTARKEQPVLDRLYAMVGDDAFNSWFRHLRLDKVAQGVAHLSVPTRFLKMWIQGRYSEQVLACVQAEDPSVARIELVARDCVRHSNVSKPRHEPEVVAPLCQALTARPATPADAAAHEALGGSPLDPRLTFDSFVVGRSNTLAHAAVRQVALAKRGDPLMFNPLYVYAGVGLGKSHLLQALAWAVNAAGEHKALYLTAEKFMYGFASAIRSQSALAYKEALRGIGMLIIDDLQFLQGRATQSEFNHTLNALIDANRQVVVAADRPPGELEQFDERLRSRLRGGLTVEVGPLGSELRLDILKVRVAHVRATYPAFDPSHQVLAYVAQAVTRSGRDLEGALNRLVAHSRLTGQPVTLELAERECRDLLSPAEPKRVRIEDIQRVVARHYNVSRADLLSARRTANVVRPRQVAMYLAKTLTLRSLPEIGRRFGGKDHTTVLHSVRRTEHFISIDTALAAEVESLKRELTE